MNRLASFGVLLCGPATTLMMVAGVVAINNASGLNLFTFSIWIIVPAGVLLCGAAAALGYYGGSMLLHQKPAKVLLLQMLLVAAAAQLLIYYGEYATLTLARPR